MKKHLFIGIVISVVFIYLSVKDVWLDAVANAIAGVKYSFVLLSTLMLLLMQFVRSFRWGLLLEPVTKVDQLTLFSVTSVGFLAIVAIPARLGELARPYLIANKSGIEVSAAISSIVLERLFDGVAIMLLAALIPFLLPTMPVWLSQPAIIFFTLTIIFCITVVLVVLYDDFAISLFRKLASNNPTGLLCKIATIIENLIKGFKIIKDIRLLLLVLTISILIWLVEILVVHFMALAFSFSLPIVAYLVLTVILIVSISIPAAPGFIGSWHFACVLGLSFFGIAKDAAFAFGVVYHFFNISLLIILGLIFLPSNYLMLASICKNNTKKE